MRTCGRLALALSILTLTACGRTPADAPPGVFFPTAEGGGRPDALLDGTLVEKRGCLFVRHRPRGRLALVLWHEDNSIRRGPDGTLEIVDPDGAAVARVGDRLSLGGGFMGEGPQDVAWPEDLIDEPIPERCWADGYWLAHPAWAAPP